MCVCCVHLSFLHALSLIHPFQLAATSPLCLSPVFSFLSQPFFCFHCLLRLRIFFSVSQICTCFSRLVFNHTHDKCATKIFDNTKTEPKINVEILFRHLRNASKSTLLLMCVFQSVLDYSIISHTRYSVCVCGWILHKLLSFRFNES